jgi:hypothetical protein
LRLHEKMILTFRIGSAAGRSPSCAVPPTMALMTDKQEFLQTRNPSSSGRRCLRGLGTDSLVSWRSPSIPSDSQSGCTLGALSCARLLTASFPTGGLCASQCSRSSDTCPELPIWLISQCRGLRSQDKRRRKSRSGHGTDAGQSL